MLGSNRFYSPGVGSSPIQLDISQMACIFSCSLTVACGQPVYPQSCPIISSVNIPQLLVVVVLYSAGVQVAH